MKDYNFFTDYNRKRSMTVDPKSPVFIGTLILFLIGVLCIGLIIRNISMSNQLVGINSDIETIHASQDYINANKLRESIDAMNQYDKSAEVALQKFTDSKVIGTELMKNLATKIPATSIMTSLTIDNISANFTFSVPNRKAAAELLLSLKDTGLFQNVQLNSVLSMTDTGRSDVSISAVMKAGVVK